MQYYKHLNLDCSAVIEKLQQYINANPNIIKHSWTNANLIDITTKIPELQELFNPLNIKIKRVSFHTLLRGIGSIHRDDTTDTARINIPVLNCENTLTMFYTTTSEPKKHTNTNGADYHAFDSKDCTLADSYELTSAVLLKVLEPHQVNNFNINKPRVACTIAFEEDLNHLW